ncbi:MAG: exonuclease SbcCD subunit D [Chloroflexi bacterium]|nr:exonuclease SbcCD subunit D [Chloroflexota bacterium]
MPEPIRLLHFADIHVGMENYGKLDPATGVSSRVADFLARLDEITDYALEHEADLTVFAGDAFKSRDPDPTQQREFARRIKRLADAMPVLLLVGNHDLPGMAQKASSVDIFGALDVPNVTVGRAPEGKVVNTRRGPVYLAWMPYPMRNRLLSREEHAGKSIQELELALREAVGSIVADLAREAETHAMPRVLAGHFTVSGARLGSERTVMLGKDVAVSKSALADPAWDHVALGHIHKRQDLNEGSYPAVVYSGSLERIDFGEEREEKGFCWVELARGATRWQYVDVAARPFVTLRADVRASDDPTAHVLNIVQNRDLAGAVVRVAITLKAGQQAALREREIEHALREASSVTIAKEVEYEARARLGNLSPETMTPAQLVERYFQDKGVAPERIAGLLQAARSLLQTPV